MIDRNKLIIEYQFELVEDHHNPGSGRYGVRVSIPTDISISFPYLNVVLGDSIYDHENGILIGAGNGRRYAFRPHEIQCGMVMEASDASRVADDTIQFVNQVWEKRNEITPSLRERQRPPAFEIYRLLPGKNCKECGYATCIAFAVDLREGTVPLDKCTFLLKPEHSDARKQVVTLLSPD